MANSYVKFEDNSMKIIDNTENAIEAVLLECAAELTSQVSKNSRVKTGQLKGSWAAKVEKTGDGYEATIGSPLENAIWEEFGTGQHAINGDGRKDWKGKKPSRAFHHAYTRLKKPILNRIQEVLKGLE